MGTDVDLYEFKETLKEYDGNEKFIEYCDDKLVGIINVKRAPKKIRQRLHAIGYKDDDLAFVVIQG